MKLEMSGRMDDLFVVRVRHGDARALATFRINADGTTALAFADGDVTLAPPEGADAEDSFDRIAEALRFIVAKIAPDTPTMPRQDVTEEGSGETGERARRKRRTKAEMEAARAAESAGAIIDAVGPEERAGAVEDMTWEDVAPEPVTAEPAPPRRREAATDEGPDVAHVTDAPATVRRRRPVIDRSGGLL